MNKDLEIKRLSREYFITLDGKPVCPGVNDEPGLFDDRVLPLYRCYVKMFGSERVNMVCVTSFIEDVKTDEQ